LYEVPTLDKLAFHDHEKPKTSRGNKENGKNGRTRAPKVAIDSIKLKKMP